MSEHDDFGEDTERLNWQPVAAAGRPSDEVLRAAWEEIDRLRAALASAEQRARTQAANAIRYLREDVDLDRATLEAALRALGAASPEDKGVIKNG